MQAKKLFLGVICGLSLAVFAGNVSAQSDEAFLAYRQKVMKSHGASMGAIGDIMKNNLPFVSHIAVHAKDIQAMSTIVPEAFKKEITEGKTDSKPEIWKEWDKFVEASKALERESAKLAEVAVTGDKEAIAAQVKKVGGACGDCHKPYRKPEGERFPRN